MKDLTTVTSHDLQEGFRNLGLYLGDVLFFHSSLKSFGWINGGADTIIDNALSVLGPSGTISVPTFVQKVNGKSATYRQRKEAWDIESSPSDVGYITEVFRKRKEAVRSDHCCDSLAAIGDEAASVMSAHATAHSRPSPWDERAFGHNSPWDWLAKRNALYLLMGVDFTVCSIFHYVQALWVEARLDDMGDEPVWPAYNFSDMGQLVKEEGLVKEVWVGHSHWQAFRVDPILKLVGDILNQRPGMIERKPLRFYGE